MYREPECIERGTVGFYLVRANLRTNTSLGKQADAFQKFGAEKAQGPEDF